MIRRLNFAWRLAATGFAFAALGLGGFFLAVAVIPVATIFVEDRRKQSQRAQRIISASFQFYIAMLRAFGLIRLEIRGAERLAASRGNLIVANHPTLLDIVLIMAIAPNARCVVKHQLWRDPLLGRLVRTAGYISNDQPSDDLIAQCRAALSDGGNLIIFPEGTRSAPGQRLRFQRGFAHIATLLDVNIHVITITCTPVTLMKGQPWYNIPDRAPKFCLEIEDSLEVKPFLESGPRPLAARKLVSYLEAYCSGKLNDGRA